MTVEKIEKIFFCHLENNFAVKNTPNNKIDKIDKCQKYNYYIFTICKYFF